MQKDTSKAQAWTSEKNPQMEATSGEGGNCFRETIQEFSAIYPKLTPANQKAVRGMLNKLLQSQR